VRRIVKKRVSEDALLEVSAACVLLVRADAASLVDARCALAAAVAAASESNGAPRTVPWSDFHRAIERAGRLLGAIGEWQRHRRAVLFPEVAHPGSYGANGRTIRAPEAGSMVLEG